MTHQILEPSGWSRPRGYANGIAGEGRQIFLAGQIGWSAEQQIEGIGAAYRETIGRHFPAMSVVQVSGLLEPRAKVEIEATAIL